MTHRVLMQNWDCVNCIVRAEVLIYDWLNHLKTQHDFCTWKKRSKGIYRAMNIRTLCDSSVLHIVINMKALYIKTNNLFQQLIWNQWYAILSYWMPTEEHSSITVLVFLCCLLCRVPSPSPFVIRQREFVRKSGWLVEMQLCNEAQLEHTGSKYLLKMPLQLLDCYQFIMVWSAADSFRKLGFTCIYFNFLLCFFFFAYLYLLLIPAHPRCTGSTSHSVVPFFLTIVREGLLYRLAYTCV